MSEPTQDAKLAEVTARAGLPGTVEERRVKVDQPEHTEHQLRTLVEGVPHLIWRSSDRGLWTWASPQWLAYTGQTQEESHGRGWMNVIHPEDRKRTITAWDAAVGNGELDTEFKVRRARDGAWIWHRTTSLPLRDEVGRIVEWLGSTTDIQAYKDLEAKQQAMLAAAEQHARELKAEVAQRKEAQAQLLHAAFHDDLTGLRNRAWLMNRLRQLLDGSDTAMPGCSVLFLDLDGFGRVNNSFGHQAGDRLLAELARRLQACMTGRDGLARIGGDEFAVLVEGKDAAASALRLAERITQTLRQPLLLLGRAEVFCTSSIGIAHAPADAAGQHRPEDLMRDADSAMYAAKRSGPGACAVFTTAMRDGIADELELETDLRHALDEDGLMLHYQPVRATATGAVTCIEALVRWDHPTRGPVPPDSLIPAAERTGLIRDLGRWVLRTACMQAQVWRQRIPGLDVRLSVNISATELQDRRFLDGVRQVLAESGLNPGSLQLEITEQVFVREPAAVGEMLRGLRGLGVLVALDDFGKGYSSLGYLAQYPVDTVKVDGSFVAGMLAQPRQRAVVEAAIRLGHAMDLAVVAEGVEEDAQLEALREMGCDMVQGYLPGRPVPAQKMEALLAVAG